MEKINESLKKLYQGKFQELTNNINDYNSLVAKLHKKNRATNPLLLTTNDDWEKADIKIMIFGQETNYWAGQCGNEAVFCTDIDMIIDVYKKFYLEKNGGRGPFWNEFRRVKNDFNYSNKHISFIYNNILKIGRIGKGNVNEINTITKKSFNIITEEIKILKPTVVIFFTGPKYDTFIKDYIGDFSKRAVDEFNENQICLIDFKENLEIEFAIRTYHPNYLYRRKLRKKFMDKVISELSKFFNNQT